MCVCAFVQKSVAESMRVRVCVNLCVCVDARARACVFGRVALLNIMTRPCVLLSVASLTPSYFLTLSHKRHDFWKKKKFVYLKNF